MIRRRNSARLRIVAPAASFVAFAATAVIALACAVPVRAASEEVGPFGPVCPAGVSRVWVIDGNESGSSTYAVEFETYTTMAALVSGTVTLFAGDDRYDVDVRDALAVPLGDARHHRALLIRFPNPVGVTGAYLSAISGAPGTPCPPERLGTLTVPKHDEGRDITIRETVDAPAPAREPHLTCDVPFAPARVTKLIAPDIPQDVGFAATGVDGNVLLLRLSAAGTLMGMRVIRQSRFTSYDFAAEGVAKGSTFTPAIFRCEHVGGYYSLVTMYDLRQ